MIDPDRASTAGTNELIWNGTYEGVPAPEGSYHLTVRLGDETASTPIQIGSYAPYMNHLRLENGDVTPETPLRVSFTASQRGALNWSVCDSAMKIAYPLDGIAVEAGPCELTWDGTLSDGSTLPDGAYIFTLLLIDETGFESNEERLAGDGGGLCTVTARWRCRPLQRHPHPRTHLSRPRQTRPPPWIRRSRQRRLAALRQAIAVRIRRTPR